MDANDWSDLKSAFAALVELDAADRGRRIAAIARDQPALARRLAVLLDADAGADERLRSYEDALCGDEPSDPGAADPLGLVGRTVGHFTIDEVLGSGGMGVAYRARDLRLDRPVALKFLLPRYALDVDAKTLLLHEARSASALDHPNVCTVFEVGEAEPGLFFAMPAYSGETLRGRLEREGALPPAEAIALARQLLQGLAAAHAAGISHRDLKPGNIMITADGTLKILDFGLAQMRDLQSAVAGATPGTMAYMSPEQLRTGQVDERTDLWSAGVVLHEMLTGHRPFGAGQALSTPWSILHDAPAPAGVSASLDAFVQQLLSKDPADRPPSARAALSALDAIFETTGGAARRPGARRAAALAFVVVAAAIAAWPGLRDGPAAASGEPLSVAVLPFRDASTDGDHSYLAEGLAEDVLNALAQIPGLRVSARRSSLGVRADTVPLAEIARRLDVGHLVDGSVARDGDRVRGYARLTDAATGDTIWSQWFDRPLSEIPAVRAEIAGGIAKALVSRPPAPFALLPTRNAAAYDLYLRGRFHWHRRTSQDLALSIDFFRRATALDSLYAAPWAGLALAYAVLPALDGSHIALLDSAGAAAGRALSLDPSLSDAHAARGYALHWQWRWLEAEDELRRAITLDPSNSTAHQWYGEHLAKMGRGTEGERVLRRAIELDPLSLVARNDLGIALMLDRRHEEALAQFRGVSAADPSFALSFLLQHRILLVMDDAESSADAGRRWAELTGVADPAQITLLARATRDAALRPQALKVLGEWERRPAPRWPEIAFYLTLIGEKQRAIDALERAVHARSPMLGQLHTAAWADPLRADPRFAAILRRLAFP